MGRVPGGSRKRLSGQNATTPNAMPAQQLPGVNAPLPPRQPPPPPPDQSADMSQYMIPGDQKMSWDENVAVAEPPPPQPQQQQDTLAPLTAETSVDKKMRQLPVWAWILIALGSFGLGALLAAFFARRK